MRLVAAVIVLAGCRPIPPPPILPGLVGTAPAARGEDRGMIVVGVAGELLGGGGVGVALRYEHAETDHTSFGAELGVGRGDEMTMGAIFAHHYLLALRGYGRYSPGDHDWTDLTYGAGLSVMRTGLVTATLHGGAGLSDPNSYVVPVIHTGFALAVPLAGGDPYGGIGGGKGMFKAEAKDLSVPHADVFWYLDGGFVAHPNGLAFALDLGFATPLFETKDTQVLSLVLGSSYKL